MVESAPGDEEMRSGRITPLVLAVNQPAAGLTSNSQSGDSTSVNPPADTYSPTSVVVLDRSGENGQDLDASMSQSLSRSTSRLIRRAFNFPQSSSWLGVGSGVRRGPASATMPLSVEHVTQLTQGDTQHERILMTEVLQVSPLPAHEAGGRLPSPPLSPTPVSGSGTDGDRWDSREQPHDCEEGCTATEVVATAAGESGPNGEPGPSSADASGLPVIREAVPNYDPDHILTLTPDEIRLYWVWKTGKRLVWLTLLSMCLTAFWILRFRQAFTLLLIPLLGYYAARGYSMVISAIYAAAQVLPVLARAYVLVVYADEGVSPALAVLYGVSMLVETSLFLLAVKFVCQLKGCTSMEVRLLQSVYHYTFRTVEREAEGFWAC